MGEAGGAEHARLQHHWLPSLLCGSAGVLLVACVTQPLARMGVGSATSLHEVFDLLLDGHLRLGIPRWVGLFGYVPAFGGVAILLAEATVGRLRFVLFLSGLVSSALAVGLLAVTGPWNHIDQFGLGLWLGITGLAVATVGGLLDRLLLIRARKRRSPTTTKAGAHVLSPVRERSLGERTGWHLSIVRPRVRCTDRSGDATGDAAAIVRRGSIPVACDTADGPEQCLLALGGWTTERAAG